MSIMAKLHSYSILVNPAENFIQNHFLCSLQAFLDLFPSMFVTDWKLFEEEKQ